MTACVMIMAGGTGGHVFPALAVADELQRRGVDVFWLGTRTGMEAELVAQAGIEIEWISIAGLRGKGLLGWLLAPFRLARAMFQSVVIIFRRRPMAILGMGGFVAGPGGLVGSLLHKPVLIHEQNAIAGLTNRVLSRRVYRVMQAFPQTFDDAKNPTTTGNPVRAEILAIPEPAQRLKERKGPLRLLVLGGSLGAQALNEIVPEVLNSLPEDERPEVWHQTGKRNIDEAMATYKSQKIAARVDPFIDDMAAAYAWADLVLCRSGALTISELAAAGVASLLVPYPHAVDDHQTANAAFLADNGAAKLLPQNELSREILQQLLQEFGDDCRNNNRAKLIKMAEQARCQAKPDAVKQVADMCMEACHG